MPEPAGNSGRKAGPQGMTQAERERFHNLLLLAKESTFEGERRNALRAAKRLAGNYGLSLEEAARSGGEGYQTAAVQEPDGLREARAAARRGTGGLRSSSAQAGEDWETGFRNDKTRFEEALAAARARGLDADQAEPATAAPRENWNRKAGGRKRQPLAHARVLLTDTHLPVDEIASIAGLDVWTVTALKLKLRSRKLKSSR